MSDQDSVRSVIFQPGQSQHDRLAPELQDRYADVDERTPADLLRFAAKLATLLNFHDADSGTSAGDWSPLFPDATPSAAHARVQQADGKVPPHLALYLAFVRLYQRPRAVINQITLRHADFFYQEVLGLRRRAPIADRAHVVLQLKKGAPSVEIDPSHNFSAGKDAAGIELVYAPTETTIVNTAAVDSLRSVFVDREGRGTVRFAPIANSSDGLGGKLLPEHPQWTAFGSPALPRAEVGFAIASPLLRMQEGTRKITITLKTAGGDRERLASIAANMRNLFSIYLTGKEGWIEPTEVSVTVGSDGQWRWVFTVPATAPAIIAYDATIHGYSYATASPVVQFVLRADGVHAGYFDFAGVTLQSANIALEVTGIASLTLESDEGALNPGKAFLPFGGQPTEGARFMIAYPEALQKRLSSVSVALQWKDVPSVFSQRYAQYGGTLTNNSFTVAARFHDATGNEFSANNQTLFASPNARTEHVLTMTIGGRQPATLPPRANVIGALQRTNSQWAFRAAGQRSMATPVSATPAARALQTAFSARDFAHLVSASMAFFAVPVTERKGFITLTLQQSFLHAEFRRLFVTAVKNGTALPEEPYTPTVQHIALSYSAFSEEVQISSNSDTDFANPEIQFFQVTPFGPRREHGFQRAQFPFVTGPDVSLLPTFSDDGELLIGLSSLAPGDSVSLLFEVAAGSADPDLQRQPIKWSVLCDDYWKPLTPQELVRDTTNGLLTSGIIGIVIPEDATTSHSILPAERVWIRASVSRDVAAVSQLLQVAANAVEVRFVDRGDARQHLDAALPANLIVKSKTSIGGLKAIQQPYASFGGRPKEVESRFRTRASERLRHKDRCITAWDYERVVLEKFPAVHRVKCVPHASPDSWKAPGNVLLVVVPDLRNHNAVDRLRPRVDADTLSRIQSHVQARSGMQLAIHARNPRYQRIRVQFGVSFRTGYEFNYYRAETEKELVRALSPWAFLPDREIMFGGSIYRSVLLDIVERLPYVDYVTDFRMYASTEDVASADVAEIQPNTPDTILVSAPTHVITRA